MVASFRAWLCMAGLAWWLGLAANVAAAETNADALLARLPLRQGLCALVHPEPAPLAVALARKSQLTVYVQLSDAAALAAARRAVDEAGLLGTRVVIAQGPPARLQLADNLADAVIVVPDAAAPDREELLRVVNPLGKVLIGNQEITKPYPASADAWSHPYYGPDNNPQSRDRLARAPYLTQFLAEPYYVPFPEVSVAHSGRVFKAFGHVGYKRRDWPWLNKLVAFNGYNGTILWQRELEEGFNIHRNTLVATRDVLYLADSRSCKLLDTATGQQRGEIPAPADAAGKVWKWMAIEGETLYALVGEEELRDETLRGTAVGPGWPWRPMTKGYDSAKYGWGFGRTLFAYDLAARKVRWTHEEEHPVDGRAVCMSAGRIFFACEGRCVGCLKADDGQLAWRTSEPQTLAAIGPTGKAQSWQLGFSTSSYLKCSPQAVYFAGPQRERMAVLAADTGRLLWQYPHGNFQLVLRDEGLYAMGKTGPSKLFDPLSGEVRADLPALRGNCTRATGAVDCVFTRGDNHGGTMRMAVADNRPQRIALMRPDCHDGVLVANGLMYWGPWMCDCNLSLVGIICLGPAGDFEFNAAAVEGERLETTAASVPPTPAASPVAGAGSRDWPCYRADNRRSGSLAVDIPGKVRAAWKLDLAAGCDPAAPVCVGDLAILSGSDGAVRAVSAADGKPRWTAYTGGPIQFPPAVEAGRVFVGSGDGWVYAFALADGRLLWRFRAAPADRRIAVYGKLASNWPVASGVLVHDGVVYAAAGIASYDGTHVYALDAATGRIRWQNNSSARLAGPGLVSGVSVQGHMLLHEGRLYLAGGNVVSPAAYDLRSGECLNTLLADEWVKAPRGRELFVLGGKVTAFERLLYTPKEYWPGRYFGRNLLQVQRGEAIVRSVDGRVLRMAADEPDSRNPKGRWESGLFQEVLAMALGNNAVVVAGRLKATPQHEGGPAVAALGLADGTPLWSLPLAAAPTYQCLALTGRGSILLSTDRPQCLCLAGE